MIKGSSITDSFERCVTVGSTNYYASFFSFFKSKVGIFYNQLLYLFLFGGSEIWQDPLQLLQAELDVVPPLVVGVGGAAAAATGTGHAPLGPRPSGSSTATQTRVAHPGAALSPLPEGPAVVEVFHLRAVIVTHSVATKTTRANHVRSGNKQQ